MSNLVGENHLPYVQEQIKTRQQILGKQSKSSSDIVWENGRTSWIRLVSSVDIDGQEVPRYDKETHQDYIEFDFSGAQFREQYLGLSAEDYSGNRLSSELILNGGTTLNNGPRFGIADSTSTLPNVQNSQKTAGASYGMGGTEFGIKPMPGITSFTSNTFSKGSLRKASIKITAHNKEQFEYIEAVYLRLGYTMLLEWGNTSYPQDTSTYSSPSDIVGLSLKDEFLNGRDKGVDYFYTKIEERRASSKGNYDAMVGAVENFDWQFTTSGTYEITLKIITIGSVIESLKVDTSLDNVNFADPTNYKVTSDNSDVNPDQVKPTALEVYLNALAYYPRTFKSPTAVPDTIATQTENAITVIQNDIIAVNTDPESLVRDQSFYDSLPRNVEEDDVVETPATESQASQPEETPPQTNTATGNDGTYKISLDEFQQFILGGYKGTSNIGCRVAYGENARDVKTYVRLGEFLNFINENLLIYDSEDRPLVSIDISKDTYCYSNGWQFSSDPSKLIFRFENKIDNNNEINLLPGLPPFHDKVEGVKVGRVMNLYYSTDYLAEIIDANTDEEGKLTLYKLLNTLLSTTNNLLGGINKLNLRITEKTFLGSGSEKTQTFEAVGEAQFVAFNAGAVGEFSESDAIAISDSIFQEATITANRVTETVIKQVIEIYDEVQPYEKEKLLKQKEENPPFNIYGFSKNLAEGNFVTDYNFNTTIDKDFATIISIGAQSAGRAVGEDATLFSKWNTGLVDRIIPRKLDSDQVELEGSNSRLNFAKLINQYKSFLSLLIDTEIQDIDDLTWAGKINVNEAYLVKNLYITATEGKTMFQSSFNKIQKNFFSKGLSFLSTSENTATPFIGFIPAKLSLTFDGLSGIRIFDKLRVNSDFLPPNYGETIEFIITELDHSFQNNKWMTKVGTLGIPKFFADADPRDLFDIDEILEEVQEERRTDSVANDSYFYSSVPLITSTPGKVTVDQILQGLNASEEVQNKFRAFLNEFLATIGSGYEVRINSAYRNFVDTWRVYSDYQNNPTALFRKAVRSPHSYGLALDIALYEPIEGQPGLSTNLLAGMGEQYVDYWYNTGIVELAKQKGLRWGGTFTQVKNGKVVPYYDCVHFDANWSPALATAVSRRLDSNYPSIKFHILKAYKNKLPQRAFTNALSLKDFIRTLSPNLSYNKPTVTNGQYANSYLYWNYESVINANPDVKALIDALEL